MTRTASLATHPLPSRRTSRAPWTADLAGTGAAVVCALVTWACAVPLVGVDLTVLAGGQTRQVGPLDVVVAAAVSAAAGFLTLRLLERLTRTRRALRIWLVTATVVALVSLLGTTAGVSWGATMTLVSLHSVVAAVVIAAGWRSRTC